MFVRQNPRTEFFQDFPSQIINLKRGRKISHEEEIPLELVVDDMNSVPICLVKYNALKSPQKLCKINNNLFS